MRPTFGIAKKEKGTRELIIESWNGISRVPFRDSHVRRVVHAIGGGHGESIEFTEERKERDAEKRKARRGEATESVTGGVSPAATRDETCWATGKESGLVD